MIDRNDALDQCSPEQVVDLLMPIGDGWGDAEFDAFVSTLDSIRDANEWWLCLTPHARRCWVELAEVY